MNPMRVPLKTFQRSTSKGTIPAGTWAVFWREEDEQWVAHCLKSDYKVSPNMLIGISDTAPLPFFPVNHFDACGWKAAHTSNPDYPVIVFDLRGTHYFPFPCANDASGLMAPPKEEPLTPAFKRVHERP